ncbi:phage portal protein [Streptomyces griseoviridis]|uniref:phage portal protein n=1 Tax=Streptomyces griseoviridis TaxID=45398 RepID=UPI00340325BF
MARTLLGAILNRTTTATANPPVPLSSRAQTVTGILGSARGAEGQMRAMTATGTLFAIVDRTANATALVEWKLWRKAKSGKKEDRVEVTSHAALDLWNKPNAFMPRQEFVESFQQHFDLTGEAWWVIARHPGLDLPLEMWPVRPDRMTPVPDPESFLSHYVYTSPDGERIRLELNEVIQLRRPCPWDAYRGLSPVLSILPDLDTARYAAEWARAFFINSAQPGGIIEVPVHLQDAEFNEMRDRWSEQHRGVNNAHRVAIIEHGAKWADRTISQRDMQFVELRGATRDAIREVYGISKTAIGDFEDINRAAAVAAKAWFAEQQTVPRLERIKAALNFELLPMFGATANDLEWDYENPVPPDAETEALTLTAKSNAAQSLVSAGYDPPAVASAVGLPDLPFDADRDLLSRIVRGAPSLGPLILPMLGFTLPEGWESLVPGHSPAAAPQPSNAWQPPGWAAEEIEAAQRWVAVAHDDEDTCQPCRDNNGKTYRNRADAYEDYPGGRGYVNCVGAKYGNECRCIVRKRGRKGEGS